MSIAQIWKNAMVVYLKLKWQSLLGSVEGVWGLCVKEINKKKRRQEGVRTVANFVTQHEPFSFNSFVTSCHNTAAIKTYRYGRSMLAHRPVMHVDKSRV